MKKTILSLVGVVTLLSSAIGFNVYKHYSSKHNTCFAGKYYWGFDVEKVCSRPDAGKYSGCNYCVMFMRNKKDGHTIGNTKCEFFTWYMNK